MAELGFVFAGVFLDAKVAIRTWTIVAILVDPDRVLNLKGFTTVFGTENVPVLAAPESGVDDNDFLFGQRQGLFTPAADTGLLPCPGGTLFFDFFFGPQVFYVLDVILGDFRAHHAVGDAQDMVALRVESGAAFDLVPGFKVYDGLALFRRDERKPAAACADTGEEKLPRLVAARRTTAFLHHTDVLERGFGGFLDGSVDFLHRLVEVVRVLLAKQTHGFFGFFRLSFNNDLFLTTRRWIFFLVTLEDALQHKVAPQSKANTNTLLSTLGSQADRRTGGLPM